MANEYMVIGAGQFGRSVVRHLTALGQSVLVVDVNPDLLEGLSGDADVTVTADATDETTLVDLGAASITTAIVAIGAEAVEASILTTALLKQLGVPRVVARATNPLHARVLHSVGADEVINPEEEMGKRTAFRLAHPTIRDQLDLGNASLAEIQMPEQFVGHSLVELEIRHRFGVTVIALRRDETIIPSPDATAKLQAGDMLLVVGSEKNVKTIADLA